MSWTDAFQNVLSRYEGGASGSQNPPPDIHSDYDQIARSAPREAMAEGLNHAFQSDATPPFPQMVSQLFGGSNGTQKAGLLNTLLGSIGGGASAPPALAGILGRLGGGSVSPQQADQISPEHVQQIAQHAEQRNPAVVDQVSSFYSQHPQLIKTLGATALAVFMARMAQQQHVM